MKSKKPKHPKPSKQDHYELVIEAWNNIAENNLLDKKQEYHTNLQKPIFDCFACQYHSYYCSYYGSENDKDYIEVDCASHNGCPFYLKNDQEEQFACEQYGSPYHKWSFFTQRVLHIDPRDKDKAQIRKKSIKQARIYAIQIADLFIEYLNNN